MNQGKLDTVKQEIGRVNIDILGISDLKLTGMGDFNSDDHYVYYGGQESLRINEVALIIRSVQDAVFGHKVRNDRMILFHFQGKPFSITVIQVYAPSTNAEEDEVKEFYEYLWYLLELTSNTILIFIYFLKFYFLIKVHSLILCTQIKTHAHKNISLVSECLKLLACLTVKISIEWIWGMIQPSMSDLKYRHRFRYRQMNKYMNR